MMSERRGFSASRVLRATRAGCLRALPVVLGCASCPAGVPQADAATVSQAAAPGEASLAELRRTFTLGGKPVPPEVFRDLGDGDIADSGGIIVTIDVRAAIGSNRYFDEIRTDGAWVTQAKARRTDADLLEQASYRFVGATANKLLVAITSYSGGGTGVFTTLHIVDAAIGHGFGDDGQKTDRVDVTEVRSIALGDRWDGTVKITGNSIAITTTGGLPPGQTRKPATRVVEARRP